MLTRFQIEISAGVSVSQPANHELIPVYIGDLGRTSIISIFSASQPLKAYAGPGTDVLVNALLATDTVFEDTRVCRINFSGHLVALRE